MAATIAELITEPGTTASFTDDSSSKLQFVEPLSLSTLTLLGTGSDIVASSDAYAQVLWKQLAYIRTALTLGTICQSDLLSIDSTDSSSTAEPVRALQTRSGLTWNELGRALGVSRRTVHNWSSGKRISERHAKRLEEFAQLIQQVGGPTPNDTRLRLISPDINGISPLSKFETESRSKSQIPLSTLKVGEFFDSSHDTAISDISRSYQGKSSLSHLHIVPKSGDGVSTE